MRSEIGCLLIGQASEMIALREKLKSRGVHTVEIPESGDLLCAAQEGLRKAGRSGGVCVAAQGEMWGAAISLSAQLSVERMVLVAPTDRIQNPNNDCERQIVRLKGFARRNLFFCVSETLVLIDEDDDRSARRMNAVYRRMCNARIHRMDIRGCDWRKSELAGMEAHFLKTGDFEHCKRPLTGIGRQ